MEIVFSGFWSAFWLFLGVVAGAGIQHWLTQVQFQKHQKNARLVLETEIELNLIEAETIAGRIRFLKERVGAGQIEDADLFLNMQGFHYSAIGPLVNSGHFHSMLGSGGVKKYVEFMRFFNNNNANWLSSALVAEHEKGLSMAFLDWMLGKCEVHSSGLKLISKHT
ncbi:MAG: hypothetical protein AAF718_11995 [Pseudomonadota bacterium]